MPRTGHLDDDRADRQAHPHLRHVQEAIGDIWPQRKDEERRADRRPSQSEQEQPAIRPPPEADCHGDNREGAYRRQEERLAEVPESRQEEIAPHDQAAGVLHDAVGEARRIAARIRLVVEADCHEADGHVHGSAYDHRGEPARGRHELRPRPVAAHYVDELVRGDQRRREETRLVDQQTDDEECEREQAPLGDPGQNESREHDAGQQPVDVRVIEDDLLRGQGQQESDGGDGSGHAMLRQAQRDCADQPSNHEVGGQVERKVQSRVEAEQVPAQEVPELSERSIPVEVVRDQSGQRTGNIPAVGLLHVDPDVRHEVRWAPRRECEKCNQEAAERDRNGQPVAAPGAPLATQPGHLPPSGCPERTGVTGY